MQLRARLLLLGAVTTVAALSFAVAVASAAPRAAGDGTLTLTDGRGRFVLQMSGSVIGRIDRGQLTILNPFGMRGGPIVRGHEWVRVRGTAVTYGGRGLRFRLLGAGRFTARIERAVGVDLSVVGQGRAILDGADLNEFGLSNGDYSLNGGQAMPIPDERLVLAVRRPPPPRATRVR